MQGWIHFLSSFLSLSSFFPPTFSQTPYLFSTSSSNLPQAHIQKLLKQPVLPNGIPQLQTPCRTMSEMDVFKSTWKEKTQQTHTQNYTFKPMWTLFPGLISNSRRTTRFEFLNMCPGLLNLWPAWKDWKQLIRDELSNFAWNATEHCFVNTWKYTLREFLAFLITL